MNHSFGAINYIYNGAYSNYNAFLTSVRGRFARGGFFSASYGYSHSSDDSQVYPTAFAISQYYGPSLWDIPQRFSLLVNYELPGSVKRGSFIREVTSGWSFSGATNLQSGTPYTVNTTASFQPIRSGGVITGLSSASGDYNADGYNNDYPNVNSYSYATDRQSYLKTGTILSSQFSQPTMGTEGNEAYGRFRNPGYADTDIGLRKSTQFAERFKLQLRVDAFNVFNRPNLGGVTADISSGSFGKVTSQLNSRFLQIGAALMF